MPCKPCCGPRLYLEGNGEPSKGFKQGSDLIRLALEEHFLNHLWIDCRGCLQLCETPLPPHTHIHGKGLGKSDPLRGSVRLSQDQPVPGAYLVRETGHSAPRPGPREGCWLSTLAAH